MDSLVDRLSTEGQPVRISLRPEPKMEYLKEAIERNYVHVLFTGTRGGTELGVELDRDASDFSSADFENQTGEIRVVGELTLNFVPVRCHAVVDLSTLEGVGHLTPIGELDAADAA